MSLLEIRSLTVKFTTSEGEITALRDLNLDVEEGSSLTIIGESGSGKSVLASAILMTLESNASMSGKVSFDSQPIGSMDEKALRKMRGKDICLIPQNATQAWDPLIRIGNQMSELLIKTGVEKKKTRDVSVEYLSKCGFSDPEAVLREYPHRLSGGMSQRAMIAMCLSVRPRLLIADEPTKGLDGASKRQVMEAIAIARKESTLMVITHNLATARACHHIAVMYGGMIMERGDTSEVLEYPLHPYTVGLRAAHPRNGMNPIPGGGGRAETQGCPFRKRCHLADHQCEASIVPREGKGRVVRCAHA